MARLIHFHFKARHNVGDAAVVAAIRQLLDADSGPHRWSSEYLKVLRQPPGRRLIRHINSHDLAIVGGGGLYSEHGLPLHPEAIAAIRIPMVIFGAGYNEHLAGRPLDQQQIDSLCELNRRAVLSSVRDQATQELLRSLGFAPVLTGDPALCLAPAPARVRLDPACRLGVNLACHGWAGQAGQLDRLLDIYADTLRSLANSSQLRACYLVHTSAEKPWAKQLRRRVPGLAVHALPAPRLLGLYGQLDLVISMMLHSSIFGLAAGTPVINLAYDRKNLAFMQSIGHPERSLVPDDVSAALLAAQAGALLQADRSSLLAQELAVRERWRAATRDFAAATGNLLP